jgi:PAS domain-containing protein
MQRLARVRARGSRLRESAASSPALDLVDEMLELTDALRAECATLQQQCSALRKQLAEREAAENAVLDRIPVPLISTDAGGTIQEVNRAAAALLGRSAPRLRNELLLHYCLDREACSQLLRSLPQGEEPRQVTLSIKPWDRKPFEAQVTIAAEARPGRRGWLWFVARRD